MKQNKRWLTGKLSLFLALVLALTAAAGVLPVFSGFPAFSGFSGFSAYSEALPAEEADGLFGDPWVNSVIAGNLPETAPDPRDDFYTAVNYDEAAAHQGDFLYAPLHMSGWDKVREAVTALLEEDGALSGPDIEALKIFREQAADLDALRAAGYAPVEPYLERVRACASLEELDEVLTADDFPFSPFLETLVAPPSLDEANGVWIFPALAFTSDFGNGSNYYDEPAADLAALNERLSLLDRASFARGSLLALGLKEAELPDAIVGLFNTEVSYVSKGYSDAKASAADYGYIAGALERLSREDLEGLCRRFPITATLEKYGKGNSPVYVTLCSDWMKALDELWTEENLDEIKRLTCFKILMESAPFLTPDPTNLFLAENGQLPLDEADNAWQACSLSKTFAPLLAKIYAEKVLGDGVKEQLTSLTEELVDTYRGMISETEWLSAEGREKALEKLDHVRLCILEPDGGYEDYSSLALAPASEGGSLFENYLAVKDYLNARENLRIGGPAKANMVWKAFPPTASNCFYDPFSNAIHVLPGFITPFAIPEDATREQLTGMMGFTIAHELSHALDYAGSQRDAYGRGIPILTEADLEAFLLRVKALEDRYDAITILPDVTCQGDLLRVENTADLCGMQAAARLAKARGLDLQAFFRAGARFIMMVLNPLYTSILLNDTHAPAYLRINVNAQMTDEFYEAFGVREGDGMYLKPEERLKIWGK